VSLAPLGGNFTGVLLYEADIVGRWLAMLKQIAPRLGLTIPDKLLAPADELIE
jgi:hypothetical protein